MRVFVAGASGAIGTRLVPQLIERGHEVLGTHRSPGGAERVRALGAEPVHLDLLDRDAVMAAVVVRRPDAIVHQATALADLSDLKHFDRTFHNTNLLRTQARTRSQLHNRRVSRASSPRATPASAACAAGDGDALGPAANLTTGLAMSSAACESLVEKPERPYQVRRRMNP